MKLKETLKNALPRFLRRCDAKSTRVAYLREITRFLDWLPAEVTDEILFDYRDQLRGKNLGPTTVRWRTTVVRSFLLFARRRGLLDLDLVADFKPPKGKSGFAPRVLTKGELDRLIDTPDRRTALGRRDAAVLVCLGVGGLRAGEVCSLSAQDVLVHPHEVVLIVEGKGKKQRAVSLTGVWVRLFQGYLRMWPRSRRPGNPFFWCGPSGGRRLAPSVVDYLVKKVATKVGINRLHPHALRHTAATLALENGEPIHQLQHRLGHSNILVTSKYLHLVAGDQE